MKPFRKGDGERSGLFTRRALLLGGVQGILLSALAGRLYQLQVLETRRFATLAEENRINLRLLPPSRGLCEWRTLIATSRPMTGSKARNTRPMPPRPSTPRTS